MCVDDAQKAVAKFNYKLFPNSDHFMDIALDRVSETVLHMMDVELVISFSCRDGAAAENTSTSNIITCDYVNVNLFYSITLVLYIGCSISI